MASKILLAFALVSETAMANWRVESSYSAAGCASSTIKRKLMTMMGCTGKEIHRAKPGQSGATTVNVYIEATCNATHLAMSQFSDAACQTATAMDTEVAEMTKPLACTEESLGYRWVKWTCDVVHPSAVKIQRFSDATCGTPAGSPDFRAKDICVPSTSICVPYTGGPTCKWKPDQSEMVTYAKGKLTLNKYANTDCSGTANITHYPMTCIDNTDAYGNQSMMLSLATMTASGNPVPAATPDPAPSVASMASTQLLSAGAVAAVALAQWLVQ